MQMKNVEELKKYIFAEYGVSPEEFDGKVLTYRAVTFEKNTGSIILANKDTGELWTVKRTGHSIDYFNPTEMASAVAHGGSLLYYFMPEARI